MDRRSFIKKTSMALLATTAKTYGSEISPLPAEGMRYRRLGKRYLASRCRHVVAAPVVLLRRRHSG